VVVAVAIAVEQQQLLELQPLAAVVEAVLLQLLLLVQ
jgi:hypothetical protein